jgi:flotillin
MSAQSNSYLNEVLAEQAKAERELAPRQAAVAVSRPGWGPGGGRKTRLAAPGRKDIFETNFDLPAKEPGSKAITLDEESTDLESSDFELSLQEDLSGVALNAPFRNHVWSTSVADHRITGHWLWKTVVVPPNVYVVHTRRGRAEPLHIGLGISFAYRPRTDAFLIIPAAVQTLLINARCICAERQGVLVQGYVQWVVDDIHTAYRRLDFSDPADRMRIVKVQLREQAEAAIKDKVATMSIDAILTDKQPIIAELTQRLKAVAEGTAEGSGGLGLKIVTVQIKEAVVSSTSVWENLQKPFRAERAKLARLAELEAQQQIDSQELEVERRLEQIKAGQERERFDRSQAEKTRRLQLEHDAARLALAQQAATDKAFKEADLERALHELELQQRRIDAELSAVRRQMELDRLKAEADKQQTEMTIDRDNLVHQAQSARGERELGILKQRRQIDNDLSEAHVKAQLIARLPEIAVNLPKPNELKAVSISPDVSTSLSGLLAGLMMVAEPGGRTNGTSQPGN